VREQKERERENMSVCKRVEEKESCNGSKAAAIAVAASAAKMS
jgi:hypothetical protein